MSQVDDRVHLNLVDSSLQLFELDPGAALESGPGYLLGAGRSSHPVISNAAFRSDDDLDPEEFLRLATAFFGARERGFSVWARGEEPADADLTVAAEKAGLQEVYEMPEMVLGGRVEERPLPAGVELRRLGSQTEAEDYWEVAKSSYASLEFPAEVFDFYQAHDGLLAANVAAFLAYLDGTPVSIAMTIVSHGVAGIYWVGSLEQVRGRGIGWAVTSAAVNAGFDLGGEIASLQASPMGESLYAAMGFETLFNYRLLMAAPPEPGSSRARPPASI